jgi:hypothetical protein
MNGEAKELRELARKIEQLVATSRISSIAMPPTQALLDYLCLRARAMEQDAKIDELLAAEVLRERDAIEGFGDAPHR